MVSHMYHDILNLYEVVQLRRQSSAPKSGGPFCTRSFWAVACLQTRLHLHEVKVRVLIGVERTPE